MAIKDLKLGDILLWWDDKFQIQVGSKMWTIPIPCPIAVHADIYIGDGKCRTSIQNLGASTADVEKRMKQFYKWEAVRLLNVKDIDKQEIVSIAKSKKCAYDWQGYYGQYLDVFVSGETFPIPDFTSKSDLWTAKLASKDLNLMYCSSFVTYCVWEGANAILAYKTHYLTSPQDIHDASVKNATRKIVGF